VSKRFKVESRSGENGNWVINGVVSQGLLEHLAFARCESGSEIRTMLERGVDGVRSGVTVVVLVGESLVCCSLCSSKPRGLSFLPRGFLMSKRKETCGGMKPVSVIGE
jgi:hypothetical protein